MAVALGWIALALAAVAGAPRAERGDVAIGYTVRFVETEGLGWREAVFARLTPVKDHETLLRAVHLLLRRWPRLHLCLVGDGEIRGELEEIAAELDISDHVHFAGLQPNEPNLHHLFDISVLTSVSEGFPNALVEAMAASRPVVATAVGGNVDAVRQQTGFLIPPAAPTELASAIENLLADEALRMRMGAAARQTAMREYHATSVIPRLEQLYMNLARPGGSPG